MFFSKPFGVIAPPECTHGFRWLSCTSQVGIGANIRDASSRRAAQSGSLIRRASDVTE